MATLQFRFNLNFQSRKAIPFEKLNAAGEGFARVVVQEVGLITTQKSYQRTRNALAAQGEAAVLRSFQKILDQFRRIAFNRGPTTNGPVGALTVFQPSSELSSVKTSFGLGSVPFNWQQSLRTANYLRWKQRVYSHRLWYKNTGDLRRFSTSTATYTQAFGPVRVHFFRDKNGSSRFQTHQEVYGSRRIEVSPRRRITRTTRIGQLRPGRTTAIFQVGRLEVVALSRLTPSMLPALASGDLNSIIPDGRTTGFTEALRTVDPTQSVKLAQRAQIPYRPLVEPFLSFFLTRQLPHTVSRLLEGIDRAIA